MPPAARVSDMHTCPMITPGTPPIPHVGGPILPPGAPTVLIGGLPAATVTNMCVCVGPPDVIIKGSMGVMINFLPAARMGDSTAHGGVIVLGEPTVMIGDVGSAGGGSAGASAVSAGVVASGIVGSEAAATDADSGGVASAYSQAGEQGAAPATVSSMSESGTTAASTVASDPSAAEAAGESSGNEAAQIIPDMSSGGTTAANSANAGGLGAGKSGE